MDDSFDAFTLWWGNGRPVNDAAARGGTAFRPEPGAGESFAWVWTTAFIKEQPMVAYFRLKVNDNTAPTEVARISVEGSTGDLLGQLRYFPFLFWPEHLCHLVIWISGQLYSLRLQTPS